MQNQLDLVTLVNDFDQVIGQNDKIEAHRGEAQLHRAVSVFLFNSAGELLIQQRSPKKIVAANKWANTACGNVLPGETYLSCAKRRLKQELGIESVFLSKVTKFKYFVQFDNGFSEREIDTVFVGRYDGAVTPNSQEVQTFNWIDLDSFATEVDSSKFAPWVKIILEQPQVFKELINFSKSLKV